MAFPTTISDITFLATASQGRTKPYISSAGNVYYFAKDGGTTTQLNAFKATDPADSFSQADTLAINDTGVLLGIGDFQVSDVIHIATQDDNDVILYHTFNMATDAFVVENEAVTSSIGTNIDAQKRISISLETGGDIIIFYQGQSDNVSGQKERVDRAWKTGGSWTVDQAVDDAGATDYILGGIVRGEADKFHLVYRDGTDVSHKSVQDVDGTLSTQENMNDSSTVPPDGIAVPVYYDDGGVERITGAWADNLGPDSWTSEVDDDGTPSAEERVDNATNPGGSPDFAVAVDQKEIQFLYKSTDDDLFYNSNDDSAGWGTAVEELDAITLNLITSNVYQRGSNVVLAYVYDDGGTIKYNEKVLRTVSNRGAHGRLGFNF